MTPLPASKLLWFRSPNFWSHAAGALLFRDARESEWLVGEWLAGRVEG